MKTNITLKGLADTKIAVLFLAFAMLLSGCSQKYYYAKGLMKAQNPQPDAVYSPLTLVIPGNKDLVWRTINGKQYVLAVTWKADTTYYTQKNNYNSTTGMYSYNTGNYPIWVTMAPQLKNKHLGRLKDKKLNTRLDQLLGLPPTANYSYFLEIWVAPGDLFRPCFNPGIDKSPCEFTASKEDAKNDTYMCWLYQYIYGSYSAPDMMSCYPFTHLGYTYDWNPRNKSHVGLSEFVIGSNKDIYINKVYTTHGYVE